MAKFVTGNLTVISNYYHTTRKGKQLFEVSLIIGTDKKVIGMVSCKFPEIVKQLKAQKQNIERYKDFVIPVSGAFYHIYRNLQKELGT